MSDPESSEGGTDAPTDLPEDCPTAQGLNIDWAEDLDASTVETFVEEYESAYYREVVVEYEDSRFSLYEMSGQVLSGPTRTGGGYVVEYSGDGAIYETTLRFRATTSEAPDSADIVQMSAIGDDRLTDLLIKAAETGESDTYVPESETRRYIDLLASLSDDFDPLPGWDTSDTLYVDVDTTAVDLTAEAIKQHGDYGWISWYYVDEQVVRRTTEEGVKPQNGTLVECRAGE